MQKPFKTWPILAAILLSTASGCMATGAAGVVRSVEIAVTNDLNGGTAMISVLPEGGPEQQIGTVGGSETSRLVYSGSTVARRFRLRAAIPGSNDRISDSFLIPDRTSVAWTLRANYVRTITSR